MPAWRIYYADDSTYDGDLYGAPGLDVIAIVQPDPEVGRHVLSGFHQYWWREQWYGGDLFGLFQYLIEPGPKKVVFGKTIGNADFSRILKRAETDPDFPPKSAWRRDERRP